jgi:outer membrane lipoprotein-sorting protein
MKKIITIIVVIFAFSAINAQSLEEIVNKYSAAIKADQLAQVSTVKITGKITAMGMEMPMTMIMKNPNKIKMVYNINGQEIVSAFDGEKGYMVNPMMGSTQPVELTGDQLNQVQNNNIFTNELLKHFKNGKLVLEGEENVNGKPAFRLKATPEGLNPITMFIDKDSYYIVKTVTTAEQMGTSMNVEAVMTDYVDTDGVVMPKKTTTSANGMEAAVITFDKIEVNTPVEDTIFKMPQK